MFDKYIIDSDNFLEMPLTTQAVYFHLNMRADDDGFVDNWKSILRVIGGKEDDLKVLISKSFVLPFETGIIVIKHWKINNYLQKDRKKQTRHIEELKQLKEQNGEYFLLEDGENSNLLVEKNDKKITPDWQQKRDEAYRNSSLPDSFSYKIRQAFNNTICPICGSLMQYNEKYKNYMPTIQHLLPISKGGIHELENIAVICYSCNCSIRNNIIEDKLNNEEVVKKWKELNNSFNECSTNGDIEKNRIEENRIDKNIFRKPTIEEIQKYCKERGNNVDAQQFFDYYEANDWKDKDGKKVKSWKQKMIANWEKTAKPKSSRENMEEVFSRFRESDVE